MGHRFRSTTDTEVVLESYRRWGADCLHRFNGMFAFALWDGRDRTLFCARDRFGIKPFYYRFAEGRLLFASEIKALLEDGETPRRPNEPVVYEFLSRGRQDFSTDTFFEGIRQLGPGRVLRLRMDARDQPVEPRVDRWWDLDLAPTTLSKPEAVQRLRDLLEEAVRLQMRADVPVGSCLSGGLDSSSLVCLMGRQLPAGAAPVKTFTLSHDDPRYDERVYSRAVVGQTGAMAHEVRADADRLLAEMAAIHWHQDEPVAGTSVLGQWAVMRAAADSGVKVLLDGQGGDEVLLGYPGFWGSHLADLVRAGRWVSGAREWRAWRRGHGRVPPTAVAAVARGLLTDSLAGGARRAVTRERRWMAPDFMKRMIEARRPEPVRDGLSILERHRKRTLTEDLPALLHYEDRNAMSVGIEARVPFLDHRLVESMVRLPTGFHVGEGVTKRLLRDAMRGVLPESVRRRSDKMGFVTPENDWLRGPWRSAIASMIESDRFRSRPYWRTDVARRLFAQLCDGRAVAGATIWRWVSLEQWLRRFCD
jgi:asparagine synthase (glutamine-hydrolysing)